MGSSSDGGALAARSSQACVPQPEAHAVVPWLREPPDELPRLAVPTLGLVLGPGLEVEEVRPTGNH
jgi:hypothetical protein